jgi:hypothetical protein
MMDRECGEYGRSNLQKGETNQEERNVGVFCSPEDLLAHIKDTNNVTAKPIIDNVKLKSDKTRCCIFQGNEPIIKNMLQFMYCSDNEAAHDFAAKFIADNSNNQAIAAEVREALYDKATNDLKIGEGAIDQRYRACIKMRKISVSGIATGSKIRRLTDRFISSLRAFDKEFHDELLKMEKDFAVAIYPMANKKNIPAAKAQKYAEKKGLRDASCVGIGTAGIYLASLIGRGANSEETLSEKKSVNNMIKIDQINYASLECIRQLAIGGYKGADKLYTLAKEAAAEKEKQVKQAARGFSTISFEQRTDAIKGNIRNPEIQPIPMMLQKNKGR